MNVAVLPAELYLLISRAKRSVMHNAEDSAFVLYNPAKIGAIPGRSDEKLQEERRTLPPPAVVRSSRHRENYGGQALGE